MKNRFLIYCLAVSAFLLGSPITVLCQQAEGDLPQSPSNVADQKINAPPITMITPGHFEIGGVQIKKQEGVVEFPALVNMDNGLLEYLIVGRAGKLHESLLRTDIEPYNLQIALLMLGLEGTSNPLVEQGDPGIPEGDPVIIRVEWGKGMKPQRSRIEEWVLNKENGNPLDPVEWIFTGSVVSNGVFMAQVEKSIVAVYHDPAAMIDNPMPEGVSDEIWFVNEKKVPEAGTPVTVIIEMINKKGDRN